MSLTWPCPRITFYRQCVFWILIGFVGSVTFFIRAADGPVLGAKFTDGAYDYLYSVMDKFHRVIEEETNQVACLDVYTDKDAAGNHFIPSGAMGDWGDISLDAGFTNSPHKGNSCIKVSYTAQGLQGFNWAGSYWQYPENNWGDLAGFYDLRGVTKIRFFAKGNVGGEKIGFKVGGINQSPNHNPNLPYRDSCDLLTAGLITLTNEWREYTIDLGTPELFWIYRDGGSPENHFVPSGWMGDWPDLNVNEHWTNNAYSQPSCLRITYSARGSLGKQWAGIYWQFPANNWGKLPGGYDLTGANVLKFRARADLPAGRSHTGYMKFFCGGTNRPRKPSYKNQDSFKSKPIRVRLTDSWQEFTINLAGRNLSNVIGGFCWTASRLANPAGCTIYLDDIRLDKVVTKDLSHVIGGFCWAADKTNNPNGCVFYLDNIQYLYAATNYQSRLNQRGLLSSYEVSGLHVDDSLRNVAFVYDNALVMLALMARGTSEDWARAKILADTFCLAQQRDRYFNNDDPLHSRYDGRLRNAYRAGDLLDPTSGKAMLSGFWSDVDNQWDEDPGFVGSSTGNIAWAIIGLMGYYKHDPADKYRNAAIDLGRWIVNNKSTQTFGGFTGGCERWEPSQIKLTWKSTEHNLDAFVAFNLLAEVAQSDSERAYWLDNASHAKTFVTAMWNASGGYFWTGTKMPDGQEVINQDAIPLDVQAWALMALDNWRDYFLGLSWVETNCRTVSDGIDGFDFSLDRVNSGNNRQGVWFEGTGQMAVAYQLTGQLITSQYFISQIEKGVRDPIDDEGQGLAAASHDGVPTGFGWNYYDRLHIGALSWYLFASEAFNPYRQVGTLARIQNDLSLEIRRLPGGDVELKWNGRSGFSFVVEYADGLLRGNITWSEAVRLPGRDGPMSWRDLSVLNRIVPTSRVYRVRTGDP